MDGRSHPRDLAGETFSRTLTIRGAATRSRSGIHLTHHNVLRWNTFVNGNGVGDSPNMGEGKENHFRGRCTAEQRKRWEAAAKVAQRTFSDWMRLRLDAAADKDIADAKSAKPKG